jgi:hypothetical protein
MFGVFAAYFSRYWKNFALAPRSAVPPRSGFQALEKPYAKGSKLWKLML